MAILVGNGGISVIACSAILTGAAEAPCCCAPPTQFCEACPASLIALYTNSTAAGAGLDGPAYTGPTVLTVEGDVPIDHEFPLNPSEGVNAAFQVRWFGR